MVTRHTLNVKSISSILIEATKIQYMKTIFKRRLYKVEMFQITKKGEHTTLIPIVKIGLTKQEAKEFVTLYKNNGDYCNVLMKKVTD